MTDEVQHVPDFRSEGGHSVSLRIGCHEQDGARVVFLLSTKVADLSNASICSVSLLREWYAQYGSHGLLLVTRQICQFCNIFLGGAVRMQRTIGEFQPPRPVIWSRPGRAGLVSCRVLAEVWMDVDA